MARKKQDDLEIMPLEMLQAMSDMNLDAGDMFQNVMEMDAQLIGIAHDIASAAINVHGFDSEKERVAAAHRQVELLGELFTKLRDVTSPDLE
jgi:hypothetical protein